MPKYTLDDLVKIMAKLRGEPGCPWDKRQTHRTLRPFLIEEAYEVVDAIDRNNTKDLVEELGDLLLQIVFHSHIGHEKNAFDVSDVISGICEKMIRRHPHIFSDIVVNGTDEVLENWEDIKRQEKDLKTEAQSMRNLPKTLPALMKALKVQEKAARVGFDWDNITGALKKVSEELDELKEVYNTGNSDKIREEIGDLIFACVNVARFLEVEPELALNDAIKKFIRRFSFVETEAAKSDKNLRDMNLHDMDILWQQSKSREK